jgi:hypothetical protein
MLARILKALAGKTDKEYVEEYLSYSVSLADLERRQRELRARGYLA